MPETLRLDKLLWAARCFKTRTKAAEACRGSTVKLNGRTAKPSAPVRPGDALQVRKKALTRTLRVRELPESRVGASVLPRFVEDLTPESEFEAAREKRRRARMSTAEKGRPTKKDRREIERLLRPE